MTPEALWVVLIASAEVFWQFFLFVYRKLLSKLSHTFTSVPIRTSCRSVRCFCSLVPDVRWITAQGGVWWPVLSSPNTEKKQEHKVTTKLALETGKNKHFPRVTWVFHGKQVRRLVQRWNRRCENSRPTFSTVSAERDTRTSCAVEPRTLLTCAVDTKRSIGAFQCSDKVIERCTKDEYSLFGSRLRSNRDSNGEYESFVQSSITISIVQMVFLSRFAENRDRKHHPCDRCFHCPCLAAVNQKFDCRCRHPTWTTQLLCQPDENVVPISSTRKGYL